MEFSRENLFAPPSQLQRISAGPLKYVTRKAYRILSSVHSPPHNDAVSIVCISDTHNHTHQVPNADYLIHAGDLTNTGTMAELQAQINWLHDMPHREKIVIAGNHDSWLGFTREEHRNKHHNKAGVPLNWRSVTYLQDETIELIKSDLRSKGASRVLSIFGSPWVPLCGGTNFAFQYANVNERDSLVWRNKTFHADQDDGTRILITHTPPKYFLDTAMSGNSIGSRALLEELWRVRPRLHIYGHVHGARGMTVLRYDCAQRSYERANARKNTGLLELLNLLAWSDLITVLICATWGTFKNLLAWVCYLLGDWVPPLVWLRGSLQRERGETILINAAMFYDCHGQPMSKPRLIKI